MECFECRGILLHCNGISKAHHSDTKCGVGGGVSPRVYICEVRHDYNMFSVAGVIISLHTGRKDVDTKVVDVCADELRTLFNKVKHSAAYQEIKEMCAQKGQVETVSIENCWLGGTHHWPDTELH